MVAHDYNKETQCSRCGKTFTEQEWDRVFKIYQGDKLASVEHMNCHLTPAGQMPKAEEQQMTCAGCHKPLLETDSIHRTEGGNVYHTKCFLVPKQYP
jgi:hypothetical protein